MSKIDACTILPQADAEALIGSKLTDPLTASNSDVSSCTYPGDPDGPTALNDASTFVQPLQAAMSSALGRLR